MPEKVINSTQPRILQATRHNTICADSRKPPCEKLHSTPQYPSPLFVCTTTPHVKTFFKSSCTSPHPFIRFFSPGEYYPKSCTSPQNNCHPSLSQTPSAFKITYSVRRSSSHHDMTDSLREHRNKTWPVSEKNDLALSWAVYLMI